MRFILVGQTMRLMSGNIVIAEYTIHDYMQMTRGGSLLGVK